MKKKASIKDIAHLVGVSIASVSYVLNGKEKEAKIGAEVADRIRAAAIQLNYQPNFLARSLQSGTTRTIGLVMEDISNPFFSSLASIIEKKAQENGYTVIIGCHYENIEKCGKLLDTLLLRQVDGIIISPADGTESQVKKLQQAGMPYVLVDRYFSAIPSNSVTINNFEISRQAVNHLAEEGYHNIAMIAFDSGFEHMNDRVAGFLQAMKDKGLPVGPASIVKVTFSDMQSGEDNAIFKLLNKKNRPDGLFFANNVIGSKALNIINQLKISIPSEIGLVCFDEREAFDYFYAPLSYIQQDLKEMGEKSLDLLFTQLKGNVSQPASIVVGAKLVIRQSSVLQGALAD
ncbi:LacI family DNA-binding transcriptional regulator [Foetidibacter luteolus]|uniref:LacI family DNA-binding transcriptional regulator n=1 Tax=Foetidibacter luteolus TaxID=2608880 RepID=UPI00129B8AEF|nr:LacI family DNA-binding transcriptional regulator [Foetidibacter luteolus]